jgi:hypothetical protein
MNGTHVYSYRLEGAKYGISFGSALAIAISYSNNHSVLRAIIDGLLSWIYVINFVLFRSTGGNVCRCCAGAANSAVTAMRVAWGPRSILRCAPVGLSARRTSDN